MDRETRQVVLPPVVLEGVVHLTRPFLLAYRAVNLRHHSPIMAGATAQWALRRALAA